jgi:GxxExxY protein
LQVNWHAEEYKHQDLTRQIIRSFYDVYNQLGHGFLESVYERALLATLLREGIAVKNSHL